MKNRFYKFLVMLLTVVAVGTGATMLNLSMQKKATEDISFHPYAMMDQLQLAEVPLTAVSSEKSTGSATRSETVPEELHEEVEDLQSDQLKYHDPTIELAQRPSSNEKQVYYARLQDMERVYTARMNAVVKETLAVQQKTASELLEIWDDELNVIYQKLRNSLSEEDFRTLRNEERAWIRNRDAAANRAAAEENYSNSTQNLAYTHTLLQWTKDRVYELAAMYYGE